MILMGVGVDHRFQPVQAQPEAQLLGVDIRTQTGQAQKVAGMPSAAPVPR